MVKILLNHPHLMLAYGELSLATGGGAPDILTQTQEQTKPTHLRCFHWPLAKHPSLTAQVELVVRSSLCL